MFLNYRQSCENKTEISLSEQQVLNLQLQHRMVLSKFRGKKMSQGD